MDTIRKPVKRTAKPIRSRKLRDDANLEATLRKLAVQVGLPPESLRVEYPSGRKFRSDRTVGHLRAAWEKE